MQIKDGDLVLLDMGCELHGYLSDLTRTWPPCGKFSSLQVLICPLSSKTIMLTFYFIEAQNIDDTCVFLLQEELYDLILQTNKESIKLCKPGTTIRQLNTYSVNINLSSTLHSSSALNLKSFICQQNDVSTHMMLCGFAGRYVVQWTDEDGHLEES